MNLLPALGAKAPPSKASSRSYLLGQKTTPPSKASSRSYLLGQKAAQGVPDFSGYSPVQLGGLRE
ncbi:hypothetical protein [Paenibacillus herberti]|uniref:hypothetical protein n=1 Tax=Paenibacillus herberti TaxID=1619309 RepID=UPI0015956694|nr:hypothetical protein [Paenibacillus herberti]